MPMGTTSRLLVPTTDNVQYNGAKYDGSVPYNLSLGSHIYIKNMQNGMHESLAGNNGRGV